MLEKKLKEFYNSKDNPMLELLLEQIAGIVEDVKKATDIRTRLLCRDILNKCIDRFVKLAGKKRSQLAGMSVEDINRRIGEIIFSRTSRAGGTAARTGEEKHIHS